MSRYQFYEPMSFNGRQGGPGYQTTYPPLLYAHDPSIPVKDEPESDSSYLFNYLDASGHESSEYSLSHIQMTSDMDEQSPPPQPQPLYAETESFLRKYLRIFEPRPLNLYSLPDAPDPGYKKPPIVALIVLAIWGSIEKKLTLQQIFEAIEDRYPSWSTAADKPWQRTIRHTLSLKAMFRHENREGSTNAKAGNWYINVAYGGGDKRIRHRSGTKDGSQSSASERESDDYEPVSSPQFAGNQRHSNLDSSAPHRAVSRNTHARSSPSNFHDQYKNPYPEQNSYIGQVTGTALEYHQSNPGPGPMTNSGISYTFVPEGMRDERIPPENVAMTGPNIIYSFYPDSMTAPMASSQLQSMAYTASTMPHRRHTDPPRDMESQMPRRTPRSRRTTD